MEEAFNPASCDYITKAIRPGSPLIIGVNKELHMQPCGPNTIHRVILNSYCTVKYVSAVSPSCIWVQLTNQRSDTCDLEEKYKMEKMPEDLAVQGAYCMAPRVIKKDFGDGDDNRLDEVVIYSRARILAVAKHPDVASGQEVQLVHLFFIDYGTTAWAYPESLAQVPYRFCTIPYQVIPVALVGVRPGDALDPDPSYARWSHFYCEKIRDILARFDRLEVEPLIHASRKANYNHYTRPETESKAAEESDDQAESGGLDHDGRTGSFSVATVFMEECAREGRPLMCNFEIEELNEQPLFPTESEEEITALTSLEDIPPQIRRFPSQSRLEPLEEDRHQLEEDPDEEPIHMLPPHSAHFRLCEVVDPKTLRAWAKWDAELDTESPLLTYQVPMLDETNVPTMIMAGKEDEQEEVLMVAIDSANRNAPSCFYGYPCSLASLSAADCYQSIRGLCQRLAEWRDQLNSFYFLIENCFPLRFAHVQAAFSRGQHVFAIYCFTDMADNHSFVRVKVTDVVHKPQHTHQHVQIAFLDQGGSRVVPCQTLLRMHSMHCAEPQKCIRMSLSLIKPVAQNIWEQTECDAFRVICPVDTLMRCKLISVYLDPDNSREAPEFRVCDMKMAFKLEGTSVEERLVTYGYAKYIDAGGTDDA